jgi:hypothetical protein
MHQSIAPRTNMSTAAFLAPCRRSGIPPKQRHILDPSVMWLPHRKEGPIIPGIHAKQVHPMEDVGRHAWNLPQSSVLDTFDHPLGPSSPNALGAGRVLCLYSWVIARRKKNFVASSLPFRTSNEIIHHMTLTLKLKISFLSLASRERPNIGTIVTYRGWRSHETRQQGLPTTTIRDDKSIPFHSIPFHSIPFHSQGRAQ